MIQSWKIVEYVGIDPFLLGYPIFWFIIINHSRYLILCISVVQISSVARDRI